MKNEPTLWEISGKIRFIKTLHFHFGYSNFRARPFERHTVVKLGRVWITATDFFLRSRPFFFFSKHFLPTVIFVFVFRRQKREFVFVKSTLCTFHRLLSCIPFRIKPIWFFFSSYRISITHFVRNTSELCVLFVTFRPSVGNCYFYL